MPKRYTAVIGITNYYEVNFNSRNFDSAEKKCDKLLSHVDFDTRSPVETHGPFISETYQHLSKTEYEEVNGIDDDVIPEFNTDGSEVIN